MSDAYIHEEFMNELRQGSNVPQTQPKSNDEQQLDLLVMFMKQQMRQSGASPEQCEAYERQIDEAAHKTKLLMATYNGDVQKAVQEMMELMKHNRQ